MVWPLFFWLCLFCIVYAYAGYPVLLSIIARIRPKPFRTGSLQEPSITVLIAAYNEEAAIGRKLENTLSLEYPSSLLQIIVAADGSDDRTAEIVKSYAARGVELSYHPERRGKMAAIIRAVRQAKGEIIVFSDANNSYNQGALRALAAPFSNPSVGAVSGAKFITQDGGALGASEGLYWRYESFIKKQETLLGSCVSVAGEILAIRKNLFEDPPSYVINDDFFIAMQIARKGYRIVYAPSAQSTEAVSQTAADEITRRSRIIAGRYQVIMMAGRYLTLRNPLLLWQVLSHKFLRPLIPFAMIGALTANVAAVLFPQKEASPALLWLGHPYNWFMLIMQCLFYTSAMLGGRLKKTGFIGRIFYLPAFLVNSNYAALVGLYRFLTRRQTVKWDRVRRGDE